MNRVYVGTAGWAIPQAVSHEFAEAGTHLVCFAQRLNSVEVNSSFYRHHRRATYERWAVSTPAAFRFSVKCPREATHQRRLIGCEPAIERFCTEIAGLGEKLGAMLVQLPPSLPLEPALVGAFFGHVRRHSSAPVVCEPRHSTWFTETADHLLKELGVSRVAADPAVHPCASTPGGDLSTIAYFRWHGSPRTYYSNYEVQALSTLSCCAQKHSTDRKVWCIFDNTALGYATENALALDALLRGPSVLP